MKLRGIRFCQQLLFGPSWTYSLLLAALLTYPLMFSAPRTETTAAIVFNLPRVTNGDEPHYLLIVNSILRDFDLNLSNNYQQARLGDRQAGALFAGRALDHHTIWYDGSERHEWQQLWSAAHSAIDWAQAENAAHKEYSTHPFGFPALLASPLMLLRLPDHLVEPAAIFLMSIITLVLLLAFGRLVEEFADLKTARITTLGVLVLTPLWHYSRALYAENLLALLVVLSLSYFYNRRYLWSAFCLGIGILIKPVVLVMAIAPGFVIFTNWLKSRSQSSLAEAAVFALPLTAALMLVLYSNCLMFGSPLYSPQQFRVGDLLSGAAGLIFSPQRGLLVTSPLLLILLCYWPAFIRRYRTAALVPLGMAVSYFLVMACWADWGGGACYGPRLIVPIIPLLMLPLAELLKHSRELVTWKQTALIFGASISFLVSFLSVSPYWWASRYHPVLEYLQHLGVRL